MNLIAGTAPPTLDRLSRLLDCANQNAALVIEALCSRSAILADGVRQSCPDAGQVEIAAQIGALIGQSQLARLPGEQVPRFVIDYSAPFALGAELFDDSRTMPGAGRLHPTDRYSVHCTPQIHGASLEQLRNGYTVLEAGRAGCNGMDFGPDRFSCVGVQRAASAVGLPRIKAAIAALSSISERRLAKLLDPTQNHGLPASLVPNPDGRHYGLMVLRYRAAALVSELSDLATPSSHCPLVACSANHLETPFDGDAAACNDRMCEALESVLALERYAAMQALRVRMAMLARVSGKGTAPVPGEFAQQIIDQYDGAGLQPIWDGRQRLHELETVRRLMLGRA